MLTFFKAFYLLSWQWCLHAISALTHRGAFPRNLRGSPSPAASLFLITLAVLLLSVPLQFSLSANHLEIPTWTNHENVLCFTSVMRNTQRAVFVFPSNISQVEWRPFVACMLSGCEDQAFDHHFITKNPVEDLMLDVYSPASESQKGNMSTSSVRIKHFWS